MVEELYRYLDLIFYQYSLKFDLYFVFDDQNLNKKNTIEIKKKEKIFEPSLIACVNGSSFFGNSRIISINGCCCFDKFSIAC